MTYPVAYIQWTDATSVDSWQPLSDALSERAHVVHTVGWLIKDTPEQIIIALNQDPSAESVSQYLIIPKQWCLLIERLTPGVS